MLYRYFRGSEPGRASLANVFHHHPQRRGAGWNSSGSRRQVSITPHLGYIKLQRCTNNKIRFEDAIDAFKMIFDGGQIWLLGWTIGNMFSIAVFNYAGQSRDITTWSVTLPCVRNLCDQGDVRHHPLHPGPDPRDPHLGRVPHPLGQLPLQGPGLLRVDCGQWQKHF